MHKYTRTCHFYQNMVHLYFRPPPSLVTRHGFDLIDCSNFVSYHIDFKSIFDKEAATLLKAPLDRDVIELLSLNSIFIFRRRTT
jgi:hypothetical protein